MFKVYCECSLKDAEKTANELKSKSGVTKVFINRITILRDNQTQYLVCANKNDVVIADDRVVELVAIVEWWGKQWWLNLFEYTIKDNQGNDVDYDYKSIVKDFWNTGLYPNKIELVGAIIRFGKGHLIVNKIIETFNEMEK